MNPGLWNWQEREEKEEEEKKQKQKKKKDAKCPLKPMALKPTQGRQIADFMIHVVNYMSFASVNPPPPPPRS